MTPKQELLQILTRLIPYDGDGECLDEGMAEHYAEVKGDMYSEEEMVSEIAFYKGGSNE